MERQISFVPTIRVDKLFKILFGMLGLGRRSKELQNESAMYLHTKHFFTQKKQGFQEKSVQKKIKFNFVFSLNLERPKT